MTLARSTGSHTVVPLHSTGCGVVWNTTAPEEDAAAPEPPLPAENRTSDGQISSQLVNDVPVAPPLDPDGAPVWCPPGTSARLRALRSPMLRLHAEIVDFCRFLEPTAAEREARPEERSSAPSPETPAEARPWAPPAAR